MNKTSKTVVFFGSGPVAAQALKLLLSDFAVEAIITKSVPPHHRGEAPVLALAKKRRIKTFTSSDKRELSDLFKTKPVVSQLGIVIDYGIIINQDVIDYFPFGIINSHFSLLPEWRGADPITFAILSGQRRTGVSLMLIVEALDEGPILAQAPYDIPKNMTTPELTSALLELSNQSLRQILPLYLSDEIQPADQLSATIADSKKPSYSRKLTKADGQLDWTKPAEVLEREIRAFIDWPKSRTKLGNIDVIITKAHTVPSDGTPGEIEVMNDVGILIIYCGKGYLCVDKIKPAGKKEMTAREFISGYVQQIGKLAS